MRTFRAMAGVAAVLIAAVGLSGCDSSNNTGTVESGQSGYTAIKNLSFDDEFVYPDMSSAKLSVSQKDDNTAVFVLDFTNGTGFDVNTSDITLSADSNGVPAEKITSDNGGVKTVGSAKSVTITYTAEGVDLSKDVTARVTLDDGNHQTVTWVGGNK